MKIRVHCIVLTVIVLSGAAWGQVGDDPYVFGSEERYAQAARALLDKRAYGELIEQVGGAVAMQYEQGAIDPGSGRAKGLAWALCHYTLLKGMVGSGCGDELSPSFLAWLLADRGAMQKAVAVVRPEDQVCRALAIWQRLWEADVEGRDTYANLMIAMAVVWDRPVRTHDGRELDFEKRYWFYRNAQGALKADVRTMPVLALVFVVDAPVAESELAWARKHVKLSRRMWHRAYGMVPYSYRYLAGLRQSPDMTLAAILKDGGVCVHQAFFGAVTAKANGIPAMSFVGRGKDGGAHAWFGYASGPNEWRFDAGRGTSDEYVTGFARYPQTGSHISDHDIRLLADRSYRESALMHAAEFRMLATLLEDRGHVAGGLRVMEAACKRFPRNVDVWRYRTDLAAKAGADGPRMQAIVADMGRAFRAYPDVVLAATLRTAERLEEEGRFQEAANFLARSIGSSKYTRRDLVVAGKLQQIRLLEAGGKADKAVGLYRKLLTSHGRQLDALDRICRSLHEFAVRTGRFDVAGKLIQRTVDRIQPASISPFGLPTYAGLLDTLADLYDRQGASANARRTRRQAEQARTRQKKVFERKGKSGMH